VARPRRRSRATSGLSDLLVLDAEGLSKAASGDPSVHVWLERARELDAEVIVSAVTVSEVVRGVARDARLNQTLKAAEVRPVDEALGRRAGRLLGRARSDATIDALVAATALTVLERWGGGRRCILLTSDPDDLTALLAGQTEVHVIAV
jgi:predicted nucleic acid-binding protein